jgi:hypothetical protein
MGPACVFDKVPNVWLADLTETQRVSRIEQQSVD